MKSTSRPEKLSTRQSGWSASSSRMHLHPLLDGEQRLLLLVAQHCHHHLVEQRAAALDDVEVTVVDRVEGTRVDGDPLGHRCRGRQVEGGRHCTRRRSPAKEQPRLAVARRVIALSGGAGAAFGRSISRVSLRPSSRPSAELGRLPLPGVELETIASRSGRGRRARSTRSRPPSRPPPPAPAGVVDHHRIAHLLGGQGVRRLVGRRGRRPPGGSGRRRPAAPWRRSCRRSP